ncbi:MAG: hypothetical protein QOI59_3696 [Gammaproteobacteria bacterium]|nr:hypothetical protein [Gammaproteobacteria bacterium]
MTSTVLAPPIFRVWRPLLIALVALLTTVEVHAEPAPFDLAGPNLAITVTRGDKTLPITQVPNLAPGDRLWIQADFPATQSARYLMVAAFLRGATNPPPEDWFYPCETWKPKCLQKGLTITVPADAQQVLLFLAPATGGDLRTLISAVRGRPGAFVRSSQDLNQASLDRARLEKYLSAIRSMNEKDPSKLKEVAPLLARSLAIKMDDRCLDRNALLQAPCLTQGQSALILNDGHSASIVEALTTGPASDLAMEASFTPQLSYGYYSPYIASVLDIARIFDSFRTAQYQYIPALASQQGEQLGLTLNAPPSFHNPRSVIVIALPAVEQAQLPPLHAVDPKATFCLRKSTLALPVEGAPLVFSTSYAHDLTLKLTRDDGKTVELPAKADPQLGGFLIDTRELGTTAVGDHVRASLQGYWGFEKYNAPSFELVNVHNQSWALATPDEGALIVGRDKTVRLQAGNVTCLDSVLLKGEDGTEHEAEWKQVKPNEVEVTLPLQTAKPGAMTLLVSQYGASQAQPVRLHAFSEAAHLDGFFIRAGDSQALLKGSRLDQVSNVTLQGVEFVPGKLETRQGNDELAMITRDTQPVTILKQGDIAIAKVLLNDGRTIELNTAVNAPRPRVTLIGKGMQTAASSSESNIELANADELPQDAKLTFSVRAQSPATFLRDEQIEVAMADESASTTLSIANGGITLENSKVAVATLDPTKALGSSAFGPLIFRTVVNGVAGDWQSLATLVRLPVLRELKCPASAELACKLSGTNLFLVQSVSSDADFTHAVDVPDGFPGYSLPVPHPVNDVLFVKLRDDPTVVSRATLAAQQLAPSPQEVARAAERQAAAPAQGPTPQ